MLINTSFNVHEEPIVESYKNVLKVFEMSKLNYLILFKTNLRNLLFCS